MMRFTQSLIVKHGGALQTRLRVSNMCIVQTPLTWQKIIRRPFSNQTGATTFSLKNLGRAYVQLLDTRPILTKSVTSAVIGGLGDAACQVLVEKDHDYNARRSLTFGALGMVLVGPSLHWWYGALGRIFPSASTRSALGQLALDQLLFGPFFVGLFMSVLLVLEGRASDVKDHLRQNWWNAVLVNWSIWVPANFINFRFLPVQYRVLFNNSIGAFWGVYLSYVSHTLLH